MVVIPKENCINFRSYEKKIEKKRRLFTIDPKKNSRKKKCELVFVFCLFGGVQLCVCVCVCIV
jgi:hypothetical protein